MREDPIVVGYDGSVGADAALAWGLSESALRGLSGQAVTVVDTRHEAAARGAHDLIRTSVAEAESALDKVLFAACTEVPGVEVTGRALAGPVTGTLCGLSRRASMLVLGSRGQGGFAGLLAGSVSVAAAAHAHCPVVVVRDGAHPVRQPVLLGVDDCPSGRLAAEFAFQEAAARGVAVWAVRALPARPTFWPSTMDSDEWPGRHQALLDEVLAEMSRQAQLLVVGGRGHGGFYGLRLGSVSHRALHHARCPVAVIRERHLPADPVLRYLQTCPSDEPDER